jgi:hypothetical protein
MPDYLDPFGNYDHIKSLPMAEAVARAKEMQQQILALHEEVSKEIRMHVSTVKSRETIRAKIAVLQEEMKFLLVRSALAT